jgi:predicted nucleic acid-binding protein
MAGFLPDTSCIVAAVCAWHPHHEPAASEIERRMEMGEPMILAAPAVVESYAVLTRLPPPHRISPGDALALLEAGFMDVGRTLALEADGYRTLLRAAPEAGIAGGRTYDAVIAACAVAGSAETLLTFNAAHFSSLPLSGVEIVVPGTRVP